MTKQLWLNLPVKDVAKSKEFFTKLGFSFNEQYATPNSTCLQIGGVAIMLFEEQTFKGFTGSAIADISKAAEVLISIDAESSIEVDQLAAKAIAAGGKSNHKPSGMTGWMYGCLFTDLDGHRWNVLYMDMGKM